MDTRTALATLAATALTIPVGLVAGPAAASGGSDVRTSGHCSGSAHWKLEAKPDDGRIEVEGEIDSNRAGQVWRWTFRHDGSLSARGRKLTAGPSGSFSVERRMADLRGTDRFVFRATHGAQVCRGTISL